MELHSIGAEKTRAANTSRDLEEEDVDGSPRHDDISHALSNFERSSKSRAGKRMLGQRVFECESGSDFTSDFGSPD